MVSKQQLYKEVWTVPARYKGNCYVFGLAPSLGKGGYHTNRSHKARPGDKCKIYESADFDFQNCSQIVKRVICDNPRYVSKVDHNTNLMKHTGSDHHLMAAILSPGKHKDFHFLRRVPVEEIYKAWDRFKYKTPKKCKEQLKQIKPNYVWAHQRGWSAGGPIIHDAKGDLILNPKKANFDYNNVNYSIYCGLFKVRSRYATVTTKFNY